MSDLREIFDAEKLRYTDRPRLDESCPSLSREWHIDPGQSVDDAGREIPPDARSAGGDTYQNQLWCRQWRAWINPSGFACRCCIARTWPESERLRAHELPDLIAAGRLDDAQRVLIAAVARGRITEDEAIALAESLLAPAMEDRDAS